jgi:hypothetical protein
MKKMTLFSGALLLVFCAGQADKARFLKVYFPDGFSMTAELAVTDEQRAQGLMFRERIEENQGMLFIFEEEDVHSFWMKNMSFPIDILWLDARKMIVHLEQRVPPCSKDPCPSYVPAAPAAFVLELQSGCAEKHKLKLYDRLNFVLPKELNAPQNPRS